MNFLNANESPLEKLHCCTRGFQLILTRANHINMKATDVLSIRVQTLIPLQTFCGVLLTWIIRYDTFDLKNNVTSDGLEVSQNELENCNLK